MAECVICHHLGGESACVCCCDDDSSLCSSFPPASVGFRTMAGNCRLRPVLNDIFGCFLAFCPSELLPAILALFHVFFLALVCGLFSSGCPAISTNFPIVYKLDSRTPSCHTSPQLWLVFASQDLRVGPPIRQFKVLSGSSGAPQRID